MQTGDERTPARRRFLKQTLAVGGTGVLLMLAAGQRSVEPTPTTGAVEAGKPADQGYRLTDHIRTYYDTARS